MKKIYMVMLAFICLSNLKAQTPNWAWVKDTTSAGGMVSDVSGNIYSVSGLGTNQKFLSKYDNNGNEIWFNRATGDASSPHGQDYHNNIALDPNGNILVSGYFTSPSITLGTTVINRVSALDMFVAKYNSTGTILLWVKTLAVGDVGNTGYSVASDAAGNAIVVGSYSSNTLTIGTTTFTNPCTFTPPPAVGVGCPSVLVVKFDGTTGNPIWAKSDFSGVGTSYNYSVITDPANNIYVGGDFGTGRNGVVKYNSAGTIQWTQNNGGWFIAKDGSGNIFVTEGQDLAVVKKLDPSNGNIVWTQSGVGTASGNYNAVSLNTDAAGNLYYSGEFNDNITFGSSTLTYQGGGADIFIVSYTNAGNLRWTKALGGIGRDALNASATDPSGNVFIDGFIIGSSSTTALGFDSDTIHSSINYGGGIFVNIFFSKLGSNLTGVNNLGITEGISIYPNPNNGQFIINVESLSGKETTISVIDVLGREVYNSAIKNTKEEINLSGNAAGLYYITVNSNGKQYRSKMMINK
jgi:hypothetical protein